MTARLAFILMTSMAFGQSPTSKPVVVGDPPIFRIADGPESRPLESEPSPRSLASPAVEAETARRDREFQKRVRDASRVPEHEKNLGSMFVIVGVALILVIAIGAWLLRRNPR